MEKNKIRKPTEQNNNKKPQSEKAESRLQNETAGKIIYDYIKKEIDKEL